MNGPMNGSMRFMLGRNLHIKVGITLQDLGLKTLLITSYSRKEDTEE